MSAMRFKRAVVVGASGGIGAALASALVDQGVVVHALSRRGGAATTKLVAGTIDIEDETSIAAAVLVLSAEEPIDLLVVATGLLHADGIAPEKSYRHYSSASFERYFAVNATGPALVAKHFLPLLRKDRPSVFAALSARVGSISDNRLGGWYGYRASKAALNMIVKTLAVEIARTHPQAACVALHPGTVATDLSQPFQRGVPAEKLFSPETAAKHLLDVISTLNVSNSGSILAWDGTEITP
ncbi:SDR family NAD(P)-dependent oxidoreductase [Tianweitania sp. BSSL-BM11]|uniref:SDR family NAD(P)-dependent oxidoreductase n=1 Tax=Tianweitania aestuarii TaxID=2814886 RepID=A0ABS5RV28_9HYPH|nr:SDR family NAD(P)-dependent oxidoreductase [Tianweitania aestuarii]